VPSNQLRGQSKILARCPSGSVMKHPKITASLEHIYGFAVRLKFTNTSYREASLYRYSACVAGNIDNNVFIIKEGDTTIAYSGRCVKRRAPTPDDFDALPPRIVAIGRCRSSARLKARCRNRLCGCL
jgi:hypothetical protein